MTQMLGCTFIFLLMGMAPSTEFRTVGDNLMSLKGKVQLEN